jgi:hypothetical protein
MFVECRPFVVIALRAIYIHTYIHTYTYIKHHRHKDIYTAAHQRFSCCYACIIAQSVTPSKGTVRNFLHNIQRHIYCLGDTQILHHTLFMETVQSVLDESKSLQLQAFRKTAMELNLMPVTACLFHASTDAKNPLIFEAD